MIPPYKVSLLALCYGGGWGDMGRPAFETFEAAQAEALRLDADEMWSVKIINGRGREVPKYLWQGGDANKGRVCPCGVRHWKYAY
jgi:hypothetical protein